MPYFTQRKVIYRAEIFKELYQKEINNKSIKKRCCKIV